MSLSQVAICNLALANLGQSALIDSLDEQSQAAVLCKQAYDAAVEIVLGSAVWTFAKRTAALATSEATAPSPWQYAYVVPEDCLSALELLPHWPAAFPYSYSSAFPVGRVQKSDDQTPFEIVSDAVLGAVLVTNDSAATLVYIAKVTDATQYPAEFAVALSWQISSMIAGALTQDMTRVLNATKMAAQKLSGAISSDAVQHRIGPRPLSRFLAARR